MVHSEPNKFSYDNPTLEDDSNEQNDNYLHSNSMVNKYNDERNRINLQKNLENGSKNYKCSRTEIIQSDSKNESVGEFPSSRNSYDLNCSEKKTSKFFSVCKSPRGLLGNVLSWVLFTLIFWGAITAITGRQSLPEGNLFSLLVLIILAQLGGNLISFIRLPPLLGMLIVGVILRSVPYIDIIGSNIDHKWSATIRKMALVVILTRAGLGLDPHALKKLSFTVIRMGIIPNLIEMLVVAVVSHFLLSFPWLWSFMLGFIFSGVSPSVVVPCMLNLSDRRLGVDKGVPTLIIAGLSIDNALSISGFGVFLGIIFSEGSVVWQAFKGPVEVCVGIGWGILMGIICWGVPNRFEKGYAKFRFFFLFAVGLLSVFGSQKLNFGGAGAMGCLTTAFVAGIGWRNQGWPDNKHPVKKNFNFLWSFFQPLLFGLIGTEIELSALQGSTLLWGVITLFVGLAFRYAACFIVVQGSTLNLKEKFFAAIAWLPKATIQAAFGSAALDIARSKNTDPSNLTPEEILGKQVLTLAVLAIVIAAPIGAIAIMLSAPKLLHQSPKDEDQPTTQDVELNGTRK